MPVKPLLALGVISSTPVPPVTRIPKAINRSMVIAKPSASFPVPAPMSRPANWYRSSVSLAPLANARLALDQPRSGRLSPSVALFFEKAATAESMGSLAMTCPSIILF